MDEIRGILSDLFYGKHTHINPLRALSGLTPAMARKRPSGATRSCWELLFHMVYWQDITIRAFVGNEDVGGANDEDSWPTPEVTSNDENWHKIVDRFKTGLEELVRAAREDNLSTIAESLANSPLYANLIVEIAHNSFHLGQIVATRRVLGDWPPQE